MYRDGNLLLPIQAHYCFCQVHHMEEKQAYFFQIFEEGWPVFLYVMKFFLPRLNKTPISAPISKLESVDR